MICPNLSDPQIKKQFSELVARYGEKPAYWIWNKMETEGQNAGFNAQLEVFFRGFGIVFKEGESSVDLLRKVAYVNPETADKDFIDNSTKLLVQLLQASPDINFEYLQNLIEETDEFKQGIDKMPEIKKIWQYLRSGERLPMEEWVPYIKEYNSVKNAVLEKYLKESLTEARDNPSALSKYLNKLLDWFRSLFSNAKSVKEITDGIVSQVMQNNREIILGDKNLIGKERVTLEKALEESTHGESIIRLLGKLGLTLTGSVSAAEQGSVYRKLGKLLHDIDWVVPYDFKGNPEETLISNFKGTKLVREFDSPGYYTKTFIVPPVGHTVTNLTFFRPDEYGATKYIASYDVVNDETGEVISNYRRYYNVSPISKKVTEDREVYNEGLGTVDPNLNAAAVDFFFKKTKEEFKPYEVTLSNGLKIKLANWLSSFTEKLKYGREKDLKDWANFIPNDVTQIGDKVFRLATESNKTINREKAKAWLTARFGEDAINIFETAQNVGNAEVHGYVEGAALFLWSQAEVGTEYHEAFHLTFRSMLSEAQRDRLYKDAVKQFGEPSAKEIADIKKQFPDREMSDTDARNLVLEEKMSEEFREYVLSEEASGKGLLASIAKFFKDLFTYIKAIFSDNVGLRDVYSLIESNNMSRTIGGRGVFRNPQKFGGINKAYMMREDLSEKDFKTMSSTLYTMFIDTKNKLGNNFVPTEALGGVVGETEVPSKMLEEFATRIYKKKSGGKLSPEDSVKLMEMEIALMKAYENKDEKAKVEIATKFKEAVTALDADSDLTGSKVRRAYIDLYRNWNTTVSKDDAQNIITWGWRDILKFKLESNGYKLKVVDKGFQVEELELNNYDKETTAELDEEFERTDEVMGKLYGESSLNKSHSKRLSQAIKLLLSTIKKEEVNEFGVNEFLDKDEVYFELLNVVSDKTRFGDMMDAISNHAIYRPEIFKPIKDFIDALSPKDRALFYHSFNLSTTEFVMIKASLNDKGFLDQLSIFNPNRKSKVEKTTDKWRKDLKSGTVETDRALILTKQEIVDEVAQTVNLPNKPQIAKVNALIAEAEKWGKLSTNTNIIAYSADTAAKAQSVQALADIMWEMGINIDRSTDKLQNTAFIQKVLDNGFSADGENYSGIKGFNFLVANLRKIATKAESPASFDRETVQPMMLIADVFSPLMSVIGESFVGGDLKAKYPTNLHTHMSEIMADLKDRRQETIKDLYLKDGFISGDMTGAGNMGKFGSIVMRLLSTADTNDSEMSKIFKENFKIEDFDSSKMGDKFDDITVYDDFTKTSHLATRLNLFLNKGNKYVRRIAIPIQADRGKYTIITLPRLDTMTKHNAALTMDFLIKAQIIQDFIRIAEAKKTVDKYLDDKDSSNIVLGYHLQSLNDRDYTGRAFNPNFLQFTAKDKNGEFIVSDRKMVKGKEETGIRKEVTISDLIEDYLTKGKNGESYAEIETALSEMVSGLKQYFTTQADELLQDLYSVDGTISEDQIGKIAPLKNKIGWESTKIEDVRNTLITFVTEEAMLRNEIVKIFRGNRAMSKNLEDFYKRMGHLTTPGLKLVLKSDRVGDSKYDPGQQYGMMDEYNELTIADPNMTTFGNIYTKYVEQYKNLSEGLKEFGLERIAENYNPDNSKEGKFDITDAQGIISLDMYKSILEGEGKWGDELEAAYKNYKAGGRFAWVEGFVPEGKRAGEPAPVKPMKFYYEKLQVVGGVLGANSEKNSYVVMLREMTSNFPEMDKLRRRMEAEGVHTGKKPIHVVNFVSGKKIIKKNVYSINELTDYSDVDNLINTNDSRGLRKPQVIPDMKDKMEVTLNRQIKKNMLANVKNDTKYQINPGLNNEFDVDGSQLKNFLHGAIERKLEIDIDSTFKELNIKDINNISNEDRLKMLKTIRDIVLDQIVDKDMHSNYTKALNIKLDETGMPIFSIPLDIPLFANKYESIIMSILNNRAFKQKIKGYEGVQIAELGGVGIDGKDVLKFYQIGNNKKGEKMLMHAEIMIRKDIAIKFGLQAGKEIDLKNAPEELLRSIGYRIPNQDKASTVALKIKGFLPYNYEKAVMVPAQLVKLMGSDFDVDKLFLMFPETRVDKKTGRTYKVAPRYKELLNKTLKMSDITDVKELNNIILDTMEAVMVNKAHFIETLSPLDDLKSERERIRLAIPELAEEQDWNSYKTELDAMMRNQAGNKLRGIYANLIAGRNVVHHGILNVNNRYAIKIDNKSFIEYQSETKEGMPTDKTGSLFLSGAVDAGKDPVQLELNDNVTTSKVRAFFIAYHNEYKSKTCTDFLNQPLIRDFINYFYERYDGNPKDILNAHKSFINNNKSLSLEAKQLARVERITVTKSLDMKSEEIANLSQVDRDVNEQAKMLRNFYIFYKMGSELMKFYKRVTPDSMDGLNAIGNIQAYSDKVESFNVIYDAEIEGDEDSITTFFFGPNASVNPADQFIGENSVFGLERGYEKLMNKAMDIAGIYFPVRLSPAFKNFKNSIKIAAGKTEMTSTMHRQVDANIMFMLMSAPDSPMIRYFTEENASRLYSKPTDNIYTRMEALKQALPLLQNNKFLNNFESDYDVDNMFFGVKFEGTFKTNPRAKEDFTKDIERLLYNPDIYIDGYNYANPSEEHKQLVTRIKSMGIDLIMNNFLTNGFNITPQSYHDIIPARYLTQKQGEKNISISDYLQDMSLKMKDETFFKGEDLMRYMSMFGGMKAEGIPLLSRAKRDLKKNTFTITASNSPKFIFAYNPKTYESSTFVRAAEGPRTKNVYLRLKSMFKSKKVYTIPSMKDSLTDTKPYDTAPGKYGEMLKEAIGAINTAFYATEASIDYVEEQDTDENPIETCTT